MDPMPERPPPRSPALANALFGLLLAACFGAAAASPWLTHGEVPGYVGGVFLPMALLCAAGAVVGLGAAALGLALDDDAERQRVAADADGARAIGRISPGRRALVAVCFLAGSAVIFVDLFDLARVRSLDVLIGAPVGLMYLAIAAVLVLPGPQRQALLEALRRLEPKRRG